QRRTLEPGSRQIPQRRGIAGNLEQSRVLGSTVGELIDKVEDQRRHTVLSQVRREPPEQSVTISGGEDFLVVHRYRAPGDFLELFGEQLRLVGVETGLLLVGPPPRVASLDFGRKESAEDRVAGEWGRGWEYREVMRRLDVETRADEGPDHGPLVEAEAIDYYQQCLPVPVEHWPQEFRANVDRERRAVAIAVVQPAGVVALEIAGEVLSQTVLQGAQRVLQPRLVRLP